MSEQVSTFLPIEIGNKNYLFFIVTWNDYVTKVGEELDKQFTAFGEDLGPTAYSGERERPFWLNVNTFFLNASPTEVCTPGVHVQSIS